MTVSIVFYTGKSQNLVIFRNDCSMCSTNWHTQWAKWVIETTSVFKVKVILWPWHEVIQIWKLKLVFCGGFFVVVFLFVCFFVVFFSENSGPFVTKFNRKLFRIKKMKIIIMGLVLWPIWPQCPYKIKTLWNLSSQEAVGWLSWNLVSSIEESSQL